MSPAMCSFHFAAAKIRANHQVSLGITEHSGIWRVCACLCVSVRVYIFKPGSGNIGISVSEHHQVGYKYMVLELIFSLDRTKKKNVRKI